MLNISNFFHGGNMSNHDCSFQATAYLNEHDVIVEGPVVEVVHVYLGHIQDLFEAFANLQVVLT